MRLHFDRTFSFLGVVFSLLACTSGAPAADVVYVWAGGSIDRIEGTVVEEIEGVSLRIETLDGRVLELPAKDIANVIRDPGAHNKATPEPADQVGEAGAPIESRGGDSASLLESELPDPSDSAPLPIPLRYREPSTALLWSLLVPGGGQFYNGDVASGFLLFGGAVAGVLFIANANPYGTNYYRDIGLGQSLIFASALASIIEAPIAAGSINRKLGYRVNAGLSAQGTAMASLALLF